MHFLLPEHDNMIMSCLSQTLSSVQYSYIAFSALTVVVEHPACRECCCCLQRNLWRR